MDVQIFSTLRDMGMKEWIYDARTHARLTQPQLGERLGVTKGNVSAWENGRHEASLDQLVRIADITGYTEPLPGMPSSGYMVPEPSAPYLVQKNADWPFRSLAQNKVRALSGDDLIRLEAAILISAAQVGLDVKKD